MQPRTANLSRWERFDRMMKSHRLGSPYILIATLGVYLAYEFLR
jgi:hypothetical protein